MMINYDTCKYFMPGQQPSLYFNYATPGKGGEISHYIPNEANRCYGGGVVYLIAKSRMESRGSITSDGRESWQGGYILCGGGGGGSIKLVGDNIVFIDEVKANGGKATDVLGAGGGGKLIYGSLSKTFYNDFLFPIPNIYEFNHGALETTTNNQGPKFFLNQKMLLDTRNSLYNGGIINLQSCAPGTYGSFCNKCPEKTFKPAIGNENCTPCPCKTKTEVIIESSF